MWCSTLKGVGLCRSYMCLISSNVIWVKPSMLAHVLHLNFDYVLLGWCQPSTDKTQVFWKTCSKNNQPNNKEIDHYHSNEMKHKKLQLHPLPFRYIPPPLLMCCITYVVLSHLMKKGSTSWNTIFPLFLFAWSHYFPHWILSHKSLLLVYHNSRLRFILIVSIFLRYISRFPLILFLKQHIFSLQQYW